MGGSGSGSGGPSTGGIWDDMCFCVDEDVCNLPMPGGMEGGPQGSGRPPVGGSGSGRPPPGGSGSGRPPTGGSGSGRPPVGGSGSGGSGSGPAGGSGSGNNTGGSGTTSAPRVITWSFGMNEAVECVKPGTSVIFEWSGSSHNVDKVGSAEDYASCSGITDTTGVSGPYTWQAPTSEGNHYFVCGIGIHCSVGNMKAAIEVSNNC